ncbi:hypothetical protein Tco_0169916 [Tanacetum coccineum]
MGAENLKKMEQEEAQVEDCDEGELEEFWDIMVEDVERLRQLLTPTIHDLPIPEPVVQADELLEITVVDEEEDCNPITDIKELSCIVKKNVEFEPFIQQLNLLRRVSQSSKSSTKTGKKSREMASPVRLLQQREGGLMTLWIMVK